MIPEATEASQLLTLVIMAVALGMDAFSVGLGMGMKGIPGWDIIRISFVVGIFHMIMPLIGIAAGQYLGELLGEIAILTGGGLLVLLGLHMVYSSLQGEEVTSINHRSVGGVLLFGVGVSIDSFSVGISLGIFSAERFLAIILFGIFGIAMSMLGLGLGSKVHSWIGEYGEALGGAILLALGMKFLF